MKFQVSPGPFVRGALFAVAAIYPALADAAKSRSFVPVECRKDDVQTGGILTIHSDGRIENTAAANTNLNLICPVLSDADLPVNNNNVATGETLTLSGQGDAGGTISMTVAACRTFSGGNGGTCGMTQVLAGNSTAVFHNSVSDLSGWTNGGAFDSYYLWVVMGGRGFSNPTYNQIWNYTLVQN